MRTKSQNPNYRGHGKPHTEESKKRMSDLKKSYYTEGGKHPLKGKKFSETSRLKMSLSHIGKEVSEESRQKMSTARSGEKHWNYKKDRTTLKKRENRRDDMYYKDWRKNVYIRDEYKCRLSSDNCKGKIEAHHIYKWSEYPTLRYIITNGITLCHTHHPKRVSEEKRLIPIFQELVSVSS